MRKNTLVILGHPDENSFCGALAESYLEGAKSAGVDVREIRIGSLEFEPVLRRRHENGRELEPDLVRAQELIRWARHLVFIYPVWWGTIPALMKGFIERVFMPGFAFRYREDSPFWDRLLSGRSAHLIVTMDSPPWYYRWVFRMPGHNEMKRTVLGFCGVKPVKITSFGPMRDSSREQREKWIAKVRGFGERS